MMYPVKPPPLIRWLTQKWLTWDMPAEGQKIYLTFDDGPVPEVTPEVLRILEHHHAKATFFCVGENVQKYPQLFDSVKAAGHGLGNHTFNHLPAWRSPAGDYLRNVDECRKVVNSRLFRPPHGQLTPWLIHELSPHFKIILWTVLTGDFDQQVSPERCAENALRNTRPGAIVVFHDSIKASKNMLFALPVFLEHFKSRGAEFVTLEDA
jgi:peptidoglycan-N-acetylglucosamine deacetylase